MDKQEAPGRIVRIRLKNFMTYHEAEILPGPNLNMILGPNGTGKSAIVCCIIVGLAGEVNLTGRGGSPADFVKKDTNSASTEIELYSGKGNYVIKRKISITARSEFKIDHKSEWSINGQIVNKAEVQKLTQKLNIKVDNLCQFLPQDSVTQFVKMNTCELLTNTLKAAGDNSLVEDHQKLIDYSNEFDEKSKQLAFLQQACKENEVNAQRLESEVQELRQRESLVKQKSICTQKKLYFNFMEAKTNCDGARQERDKLKEEISHIEGTYEPHKQAEELYKNQASKYRECIASSEDSMSRFSNLIQKTLEDIENRKLSCQSEFAKFKSIEREKEERERTIRLKHQELRNTEAEYDKIKDADYSRELSEAQKAMELVKEAINKNRDAQYHLKMGIDETLKSMDHLKSKIEDLLKIRSRKDALLRNRSPEAAAVLDWLSKNSHLFREKVYAPIMCELNLKEEKYKDIVENAISRQELLSFVCTNEDDLKLFTRSVRDTLRTPFNVILAPKESMQRYKEEAAKANPLNLKTFLLDLIDAPEPIMKFLCASDNFHLIPVEDECNDMRVQQIIASYKKAYVGNQVYSSSYSRYDNQKMTVSENVTPAQWLLITLDTSQLQELNRRLSGYQAKRDKDQAEYQTVIQEDDRLKKEWGKAVANVKEFKSKHEQKANLLKAIEISKSSIAQLEGTRIDVEAAREKLQQAVTTISRDVLARLQKLVDIYKEFCLVKQRHMLNLLIAGQVKRNHKLAFKRFEAAKEDSKRLNERLNQKILELSELKKRQKVNAKIAAEEIPNFNDGKLDNKTKRNFNLIEANTLEELRNKEDELTVRIQRIYKDANNTVMNEFNRQTQQLREKRLKIQELESSIKVIDGLRDTIKSSWLPKLHSVIEVIDKNYKEFMQSLSYDGQVKLDFEPERPNDFSSYGVMILVKYRDTEQLIPLSSTRQSGGERSVATMIYMLALQTKTTVPFRCVDEINQGMDQENERKVFELLVKTADTSSSQYFLVSPKLLSNLPYSRKMKIHIVFNGKKLRLSWNE